VEFLGFLDEVYEKWGQGKELHIVIDNFSAHRTLEVIRWVEKHKSFHFHFTPTRASWLNQVELWFSILSRQLLFKQEFELVPNLTRQLLAYIEEYDKTAKPFAWTYKGEPLKIN